MVAPKQFKTILVAVDDSIQGENALAYAISEAQQDASEKLIILSIFEEGDMDAVDALDLDMVREAQAKLTEQLQNYKQIAENAGVANVEILYLDGKSAGKVIVEEAIPATKADLVVVGAHSKQGFFEQLGSQATYVARKANISVMVVRDLETN
ncbi:MAG TPA: universal stress protein [Lactobacillaceae bacterium]|jgi:nucleotide-binding universal stress UspA family protein